MFIWNVAPVVCLAAMAAIGGLAFGLATILGVIGISDIIQIFRYYSI